MNASEEWQGWKEQVVCFLEENEYRLAVKEDLVDNKEMLMIEVDPGDTIQDRNDPDDWGTRIILGKHPNGNGKVYYHMGFGGGRCFVPEELFLGGMEVMISPKTILFIVRK
jgi:hypothetical protein